MGWGLRSPAVWVLNKTTHRLRAMLGLRSSGGRVRCLAHPDPFPIAPGQLRWPPGDLARRARPFGVGAVRASFSHSVIWPWLAAGPCRVLACAGAWGPVAQLVRAHA